MWYILIQLGFKWFKTVTMLKSNKSFIMKLVFWVVRPLVLVGRY
jgi:hypothetical protein